MPMVWKIRYADCSHSQRSGAEASVIPPVMCSPMSWSDSFSISDSRSMVYACSAAMFGSAFSACTPPAACHDEPAVSTERSTSATSVQPSLARW